MRPPLVTTPEKGKKEAKETRGEVGRHSILKKEKKWKEKREEEEKDFRKEKVSPSCGCYCFCFPVLYLGHFCSEC